MAQQNVPLFGGSAGTIIWGETISTAIGYDDNEVGLSNLSGFKKTFGYEVWCHYQIELEKEKVREYISKYNLQKVIALPDDAGIVVTESTIKCEGKSSCWVFDKGEMKEIPVGGKIIV